MRILSTKDIIRALNNGASAQYIRSRMPVGSDPEYVLDIIKRYCEDQDMAIGWDENINFGVGKTFSSSARKRKAALKMETMKYQSRYIFTDNELKQMEKYVLDDEGNKIKQKEHFNDEDFKI